jgi:hypothetical protein
MKKQTITKQNIQEDLLTELNKRRALAIWLTAVLCVSIILFAAYIIAYINGADLQSDRPFFFAPIVAIPVGACVILLLAIFLAFYYYLDLYKIKTGKIGITEEKLCQKAIESVSYYRRSEKENALYFPWGRVAVNEKVYSCSNIGDTFYIVFLKSKKRPSLAYPAKYYEIEKQSPQNEA